MACSSLVALLRQCGSEGIIGGLEKLYMISYSDLAVVSGTSIYTTATNGVVNDIGLASGKTFVEIGLLKSSSGLKESLVKENTKGISFFTQEFTLVLGDLTIENRNWVQAVLNQPVAAILKSRTGKYFAVGLNGQFEISGVESGTGQSESDAFGYNMTFQGLSTSLIPQVDSSLVPDLI